MNTKTKNMVGVGLFTAIITVLQLLGGGIKFGVFSISLVLLPIVVNSPTPTMFFVFVFICFPPCCPSGQPDGMQIIKCIYNGEPLQIKGFLLVHHHRKECH